MTAMKKNQPIYEEMRSLSPYYLTMSGVYLTIAAVLCFAFGGDYSLPIGAMYGIILSALNFFLMGKSAQAALQKSSSKSAQTYMNVMYCVRYLGLFGLLRLIRLFRVFRLLGFAFILQFVFVERGA